MLLLSYNFSIYYYDLSKNVYTQPKVMLPYSVKNYVGGGYPFKSKEGRSAQTYTVITETLKWVKKHAPYCLKKWALKAKNLKKIFFCVFSFSLFFFKKNN